jgi:hypothetical protein
MNFYAAAVHSFQESLNWMERQGRKDSPEWHLANGLLRLAQGLKQDHDAQEDRMKSFARSILPSELESGYEVHLT